MLGGFAAPGLRAGRSRPPAPPAAQAPRRRAAVPQRHDPLDRGQRQPAARAGDRALLHRAARRRALRPRAARSGAERPSTRPNCSPTSQIAGDDTGDLVIQVRENPVINRIVLEGNKRHQGRQDQPRDPARAAADLHPLQGPRRRRPDHRALPAPGPLRRHGRAARSSSSTRTASTSSSRSTRGRKSKVRQINIIGNEKFRRRRPARRDGDPRGTSVATSSQLATTATIPTGWPTTSRSCASST